MRQGNGVSVAVAARGHEADGFAGLDLDLAVADGADADLGSLEILKDADGTADLPLQRADVAVDLGVVVLGAVAEVQAEDVDARLDQLFQHFRR